VESITLHANGFGYEIRRERNLHLDGRYIIIEFEDGYQHALIKNYGWSEEEAENEVDKVMEGKLQENGLNCELIWEDREVFLIEKPSFSAQNVAKSFITMFPDSVILEQSSTGILSKFTKILGFNKN
jgi:hypothetical protein